MIASDSTVCVDIPANVSLCQGIGYNKMRLPNLLHHETLTEVRSSLLAMLLRCCRRCKCRCKCLAHSPIEEREHERVTAAVSSVNAHNRTDSERKRG